MKVIIVTGGFMVNRIRGHFMKKFLELYNLHPFH